MPMTHVLRNRIGDLWHLTTPDGQFVDAVTAPSQAEAALAVQHLVPRDGHWQGRRHGQYTYQAPGRMEVLRRSQGF
jgi:hypothetical protein